MKNRVLIVGSGGRVRNNFLPLLSIFSDRFTVAGIISRTFENAKTLAERWDHPAIRSLAQVDWSKVDVVVVSIIPRALPQVLSELASYRRNLTIIVDTPALLAGQILQAGIFSKFPHVLVAEDFMNFPQFEMMRRWAILNGPIRSVTIDQAGYDYHATALARSFFGFRQVAEISQSKPAYGKQYSTLKFDQGASATIAMPYKRPTGTVTVNTKKGRLVWRPESNDEIALDGTSFVIPRFEGGVLAGFCADNIRMDLPHLQQLLDNDLLEDQPMFNLLKTCGLARIFEAIEQPNLNSGYCAQQGIYDAALSRLLKRHRWLHKPALRALPVLAELARPEPVTSSGDQFRRKLERIA
jgi:hypothetical protein